MIRYYMYLDGVYHIMQLSKAHCSWFKEIRVVMRLFDGKVEVLRFRLVSKHQVPF